MKMKIKPIVFENPEVAPVLTEEQAIMLGLNPHDNNSGDLETHGPWNIPVKYKALCITCEFDKGIIPHVTKIVLFGKRTLNKITQHGYGIEGWVSVKGKKYSAFTTSKLFTINGKLINCDVIFARIKSI